mmetsp:Transcript_12318/g.25441  ORF Transcript_12318/g.25441 Transcript_12318/m.25441 type:complete len:153 (-) Transcript_12318:228-686(-)
MLQRIEIMSPSTSNDSVSQQLRPQLVSNEPIRRKRVMVGNKSETGDKSTSTSTSARIRDETMELLPMPPRKRLRRAKKVYAPAPKVKTDEYDTLEPWWMHIQIGDERPATFGGWQENKNVSDMDELERENEAYSIRSGSITSIDTTCSEITF